jgi:mono/diheme cytochrome c family protein
MTRIRKPIVGIVLALAYAAPAGSAESALEQGRRLFTKDAAPPCALCHTLKDAGAAGAIGPSLDEIRPDRQRVAKAVRSGIGAMPPFASLSDQDVEAIAEYVSKASGAN